MILHESIDLETQITALIEHGWYQDARNAIALTAQHGLICKDAFDRLTRLVAGKPATANHGHELYGCMIGFDSNTVVSSLQFERLTNLSDMKKAFKQAVNKIEIETSSQCNRHCAYCPNSMPDMGHRRRNNDFLDPKVFTKILEDLKEIDYDQKISLVGLNEFFMHEENFEYLELAKKMLPKCQLTIYSNGDYITQDYILRAEKAGLGMLVISFHMQEGKPWVVDDVLSRAQKFSKRTGLQLVLTDYTKNERLEFQAHMGGLHVTAGLVNWKAAGHNWGGLVDAGKNVPCDGTPCQLPVNVLCISHEGDYTLCCNVPRERTPGNIEHGAVMGSVMDYPSIFHAYASDAMLYWRQHSFSTKQIPTLCQNCSGRNSSGNELNKALAEHVEQQHRFVKRPKVA